MSLFAEKAAARQLCMRLLALALWVGLLSCTRSGEGGATVAQQTSALEQDRYFEAQTRVRFPLLPGVSVDTRHYDPTLPLKKFRHSIRLVTNDGVAVLIDVWDNPGERSLDDWFGEHLSFLIDAETKVSERAVTTQGLRALLLEQPRSEQAISMAVAVFASGHQVFRVTCIDAAADGSALPRALFESVLAQLELGAGS